MIDIADILELAPPFKLAVRRLGPGDAGDDWIGERVHETQAQRQRREMQEEHRKQRLSRENRRRDEEEELVLTLAVLEALE